MDEKQKRRFDINNEYLRIWCRWINFHLLIHWLADICLLTCLLIKLVFLSWLIHSFALKTIVSNVNVEMLCTFSKSPNSPSSGGNCQHVADARKNAWSLLGADVWSRSPMLSVIYPSFVYLCPFFIGVSHIVFTSRSDLSFSSVIFFTRPQSLAIFKKLSLLRLFGM